MSEFPSNSRTPHEDEVPQQREQPRPKMTKIVTGKVTQRKPSILSRLREQFGGADGKSVIEYIILDVMAPAAKTMVEEAFTEGIHRMLNPNRDDSRDRRTPTRRAGNRYQNPYGSGVRDEPYIPYNRSSQPNNYRPMSQQARRVHDFDEIVLFSRKEAEDVLFEMQKSIDRYGTVSVLDLYGLTGVEGTPPDDSWGWFDMRDASASRTRDGQWLLNLPKPTALN